MEESRGGRGGGEGRRLSTANLKDHSAALLSSSLLGVSSGQSGSIFQPNRPRTDHKSVYMLQN
uniref:Uncharacterized protein n=1 Tax=Cucumis melo TaxID=3656 RepID=A0A9I9E113_CUCME